MELENEMFLLQKKFDSGKVQMEIEANLKNLSLYYEDHRHKSVLPVDNQQELGLTSSGFIQVLAKIGMDW